MIKKNVENDFYVYIYLDPRKPGEYFYEDLKFDFEPFYVGKGKGNRIFRHTYLFKDEVNNYKINKIKKIKSLKLNPIILKLVDNLNETMAFEKEKEIILKIGRLENGPLVNFSDGGEGQSGYRHTENDKKRIGTGVKNSERYQKSIKSEEHRKKLSDSLKGHKPTLQNHKEETKDKIRNAKMGEKNAFYNKTHSAEQKEKWSIERKGIKNSNSKLYEIQTPDNEFLYFKGREEIKNWINSDRIILPSFSGLIRNGKSKGYSITSIKKLN